MPPQHDCKDFENFRCSHHQLFPPASNMEAEIKRLREQVAELEGTRTAFRVRRRVSRSGGGRVHPIDAKFDPGRASTSGSKIARQIFQEALVDGNLARVLELTLKMVERPAEWFHEVGFPSH